MLAGAWAADPQVALDVYQARKSSGPRRVTFVSDQDSLGFEVQPGGTYDFVVVLTTGDSCHTRISTLAESATRIAAGDTGGPMRIPITVRHGKLHLVGRLDGSQPLDLIFDTGADTDVLYPSALRKRVSLKFDGAVTNRGTGGATLRSTSSDHRLEIAGLRWEHEPVLFIERQADAADGIVGYPAFEDKVLELDFERMEMLVHDALPASAVAYARVAMPSVGSLTAVPLELSGGSIHATGEFLLDTGGTGALLVNQGFVSQHGLAGRFHKLGTSVSHGVGSGVVRNERVRVPALTLAGFTLHDVPVELELPSAGDHPPPGGALCMDVLTRFHILLDYPREQAYFEPNRQFAAPFPVRRFGVAAAFAFVLAATLLTWLIVRSRTRTPAGA